MKINRREFIEASGLTVAASLVASANTVEPQSRAGGVKSLKAHDAKVRELLSRMTLEEKVGQMV